MSEPNSAGDVVPGHFSALAHGRPARDCCLIAAQNQAQVPDIYLIEKEILPVIAPLSDRLVS